MQTLYMFIPVLLGECYLMQCKVRICLTGWMRSLTVRVVQVGVSFQEGLNKCIHNLPVIAQNREEDEYID